MRLLRYISLVVFIGVFGADRLCSSHVEDDDTVNFKWNHARFEILDSTQKYAYRMLEELQRGENRLLKTTFWERTIPLHDEILFLSADSQTEGIGSHDRLWYSPKGGVYITGIIPWPADCVYLAPHLSQVANVAVCEVLESLGLNPQIKWVNDTIINDRKCAGILCGLNPFFTVMNTVDGQYTDTYYAAIVGIGLNVNMTADIAREKYDETTDTFKVPFTSMHIESGKIWDVQDILTRVIKSVTSAVDCLLREKNFERDFLPEVKRRLAYVGQLVEYSDDSGKIQRVQFFDVNNHGEMISSHGVKNFGRIRPITD